MSEFKVEGLPDLEKLRNKEVTWTPPHSLEEFLDLVSMVIETSKYTDSFMDGSEQTLENLRAFVQVKANRIKMHPDVEECIDVAAYAYMVYHILMEKSCRVGSE
ncbi:MAG: hypothetical protein WC315_00430 [Candidatus Omnitrophota bacterium]|jgi:hypothetical protein